MKPTLSNSKGQTTIEYVLIVFMSVLILIAFSSQVYKPMGEAMDQFFGEYLQCLLETGELPQLGAEEETECGAFMSIGKNLGKSGKQNAQSKFGSNDSSGGSGNKSNNSNAKNSAKSDANGAGGGGGGRPGYSNRGKLDALSNKSGSRGVEAGADENVIQVGSVSDKRFFKSGRTTKIGSSVIGSNTFTYNLSGSWASQVQALQEKKLRQQRALATAEEFGIVEKNKKFLINPPKAKKLVETDEKFDLSMGNVFRIALIVIILIAIFFMVGRQALQITKDWEK